MTAETIISRIADAREKRAELKAKIAGQGFACFSISLNIPGYPKVSDLNKVFFKRIIQEIKDFWLAHRIIVHEQAEQIIEDEAGNYYLVPFADESVDLFAVKDLCESFEMSHNIGRIIDIDIADKNNQPVSSGKAKLCIYCKEKPAFVCMHEQNHSVEEIRELIEKNIDGYLQEVREKEVCRKLSAMALKSMLYEVSLSPKPGLVNKFDSGIHTDMNYYTFLDSSSIISTYFFEIAQKGWNYKGNLNDVLPQIRTIGLKMERSMLEETNKVNTQKGIIFLLGISLFASAYVISGNQDFKEIQTVIQKISEPLKEELDFSPKSKKTHGETCLEKYGKEYGGGARQEAILGMPTVFEYGLPQLEDLDSNEKMKDKKLISSLLAIMSKNNDTNILYRSSHKILKELQEKSDMALVDILVYNNFTRYFEVIDYCRLNAISPGGSADLLAVSIFFNYVKLINQKYD